MNSVYSLVLSDELVAAIDREAARAGKSRSAMVGEILAQHLAVETPKKRMQTVLGLLEELVSGAGVKMVAQSGNTAIGMAGALNYRYNPAVHYDVVLCEGGNSLGELRVFLRSRNPILQAHFARFFEVFDRLESEVEEVYSSLDGLHYTRVLPRFTENADEAAARITALINRINRTLNAYFDALSVGDDACRALVAEYEACRI